VLVAEINALPGDTIDPAIRTNEQFLPRHEQIGRGIRQDVSANL
jgi:hypothetical protein